jgi:hypothetical protein
LHIWCNWNANLPCHHRLWHASEGFLKERQTDHMTLNLIESFLRPLAAGPKGESKQWASGAVDHPRIRPLLAWTMHVPLTCLTKSNILTMVHGIYYQYYISSWYQISNVFPSPL